jgi:putative CocE/NonD family hydrolase
VSVVVELSGGRVVLERDVGVVVRDGVRLSCDVYRPNREGRFPALLEHIPYRKDDFRHARDRAQGVFFAEHGFVSVRLDVRGTGSSEGIAQDEYTAEEQKDGCEVVEWMARQPWCTGKIGSWGVSYGGFSCIQLAARRPPSLRAIAPVYATDDRYTDDMHFFGGALCALELAHYPIRMLAMNALPPLGQPDEEFCTRWRRRIDETPPWIIRWLEEQQDSPYWRNGSLRPDYERIQCPVFIVSGWRDGYRTAGLRMASRLSAPWQLLAGPWAHFPPDVGRPGPAYPFLGELVEFFRRHLGDAELEAPARPRTVFYLTEFDSPARPPKSVSGRWLSSESWPEDGGEPVVLHLTAADGLDPEPEPDPVDLPCPFSYTVGVTNGNWCPPPPAHGLPADQRPDEARSLVFTSDRLDGALDVLGMPTVRLRVSHPGPAALVSVRLADVAPDGQSQLVTRGVLNLAHRTGSVDPEPSEGPVDVEVELQATGWRFRAGHRIRIAVSGSDWPTVWPLPSRDLPVVHLGGGAPAELRLPRLPADARPFEPAGELEDLRSAPDHTTASEPEGWRIVSDTFAGTSGIEAWDAGTFRLGDEGLEGREARTYGAALAENDPLGAEVTGETTFDLARPGLRAHARAWGRFTATSEAFDVELELDVRADGETIAERRWRERIPRRLC